MARANRNAESQEQPKAESPKADSRPVRKGKRRHVAPSRAMSGAKMRKMRDAK